MNKVFTTTVLIENNQQTIRHPGVGESACREESHLDREPIPRVALGNVRITPCSRTGKTWHGNIQLSSFAQLHKFQYIDVPFKDIFLIMIFSIKDTASNVWIVC